MKKDFHSDPMYNNKFLKTKIKSLDDEATGFYYKEISKADSNFTDLAVKLINFIVKREGHLSLQQERKIMVYFFKTIFSLLYTTTMFFSA